MILQNIGTRCLKRWIDGVDRRPTRRRPRRFCEEQPDRFANPVGAESSRGPRRDRSTASFAGGEPEELATAAGSRHPSARGPGVLAVGRGRFRFRPQSASSARSSATTVAEVPERLSTSTAGSSVSGWLPSTSTWAVASRCGRFAPRRSATSRWGSSSASQEWRERRERELGDTPLKLMRCVSRSRWG